MGTTQLNIRGILDDAAKRIPGKWIQESAMIPAYGLDTALAEAIEDSPWIRDEEPVFPPEPPLTEDQVIRKEGRRLMAVYSAVYAALEARGETAHGERIRDEAGLQTWNDFGGRNQAQVIAVLRNAEAMVSPDCCLCNDCAIAEEEPLPAVVAVPPEDLPGCGDKCDISELCGCSEHESHCSPATAPFPPGYASNAVECECSACRAELARYEGR